MNERNFRRNLRAKYQRVAKCLPVEAANEYLEKAYLREEIEVASCGQY